MLYEDGEYEQYYYTYSDQIENYKKTITNPPSNINDMQVDLSTLQWKKLNEW